MQITIDESLMKVAIYSGRIPASIFIERLIKGLADRGVQVWLFGEIDGPVTYVSQKVRVCGWQGGWGRKIFLLRFLIQFLFIRPKELIKLWSVIDASSLKLKLYLLSKYLPVLWYTPDVFHLQWVRGVQEWRWVQKFGMRLVVSLRGAQVNYVPIAYSDVAALYRQNFPHVDGFHAVSKAIGAEAIKYGAPVEKIRCVYSGLNLDFYRLAPYVYQSSDTLKIISIGRPHWKKGYTYAIDAIAMLKDKVKFEYTIIGAKHEEYIFQVNQLGLEKQINLLDKKPHEQVMQLLRSSHLLLLPSVEEGIANVVLEAMAVGVPVISTDCGGMAEVIEDSVTGFLISVRSPQAIANAVLKFSRLTTEERLNIITNAKRKIERQHSLHRMVKDMLELYDHVLNNEAARKVEELLPHVK